MSKSIQFHYSSFSYVFPPLPSLLLFPPLLCFFLKSHVITFFISTSSFCRAEDSGLLTDKESLPVRSLVLGDIQKPGSEAAYMVGSLRCHGDSEFSSNCLIKWQTYPAYTETRMLCVNLFFKKSQTNKYVNKIYCLLIQSSSSSCQSCPRPRHLWAIFDYISYFSGIFPVRPHQ